MGPGSGIDASVSLNTALDAAQRARYQNSRQIQYRLREAKTVAIVGLSGEKTKASNMVASYLQDEGYRVIPVHPKASVLLGEKVYPRLSQVDLPVDIAVIFRPAEEVAGITEEAIQIGAKCLWMQLRIIDLEAAERALDAGLEVVVDRCIKMEHGRYGGALHFAGMNTEVISARRRKEM